ncbi:hypothetical protein SprV_0100518600 [Sparganum proliferum]
MSTINLHDNAPVHRSEETTVSLSACGRQAIFLPANSPDLSPIEPLIALTKRKWYNVKKNFSMYEELDFCAM